MSDKTGIAWTNATWNPVTGCTKVSQGCKHCYAEREWGRLSVNPKATAYYGREFTDIRCHPDRLTEGPIRWRKPRMILVNSMSDLFHEKVPFEFIDEVFEVINCSPMHTFQILTKRPERMLEYFQRSEIAWAVDEGPLDNIWLGVSVEDQATADERLPLLLQVPAAVRWVSAEPLLDSVEINFALKNRLDQHGNWRSGSGLAWVVCGGESGPRARPMHAEWARKLRDDCAAAGVPFFMKQLGAAFVGPDDGFGLFGAVAPYTSAKTYAFKRLKDRAGANMEEWPEDLRVREWPKGVTNAKGECHE
ncbi:DUF5131 family protein [Acidithiobacillus ferrianus]|uniref:DUF5131 family protein n=1 Tax=Acidithiobacillus ferrianus TaxID=2678518 RepID=UPI0034E450C1